MAWLGIKTGDLRAEASLSNVNEIFKGKRKQTERSALNFTSASTSVVAQRKFLGRARYLGTRNLPLHVSLVSGSDFLRA